MQPIAIEKGQAALTSFRLLSAPARQGNNRSYAVDIWGKIHRFKPESTLTGVNVPQSMALQVCPSKYFCTIAAFYSQEQVFKIPSEFSIFTIDVLNLKCKYFRNLCIARLSKLHILHQIR